VRQPTRRTAKALPRNWTVTYAKQRTFDGRVQRRQQFADNGTITDTVYNVWLKSASEDEH
jgi:hypothetical protein